jgi:glycosyltransferase involved in cell wall biosynthesis
MVVNSPLVSVVIPTHNRSGLLTLTLRSALRQHGVDLEVIVIDDGSTDDTAAAVARIGDPRVRYVRHATALGVSTARNHGIEESRGDWIAFLDDDDLWAPDKLASQLEAAGSSATWVYTGDVEMDARQRVIAGSPPPPPSVVVRRLPRASLVPGGCSGVIATRKSVTSAGSFDPAFVSLADWDLWIRLARTGPPAWVREPLVGYRVHPGQMSLDVGSILREADAFERKHGWRIDRGDLHHYLGYQCLIAGSPRQALRQFAQAALRGNVIPAARSASQVIFDRFAPRLPRRRRPDPHAAWRAKAEAWLAPLVD